MPVAVCQKLTYTVACTLTERTNTLTPVCTCACLCVSVWRFWRREGAHRSGREGGAACSSRSSCPLGVKDTDVTALITEAGSQRYKHSQQQLNWALLGSTHPPHSHFTLVIPLGWTGEILSTRSEVERNTAFTYRMQRNRN